MDRAEDLEVVGSNAQSACVVQVLAEVKLAPPWRLRVTRLSRFDFTRLPLVVLAAEAETEDFPSSASKLMAFLWLSWHSREPGGWSLWGGL